LMMLPMEYPFAITPPPKIVISQSQLDLDASRRKKILITTLFPKQANNRPGFSVSTKYSVESWVIGTIVLSLLEIHFLCAPIASLAMYVLGVTRLYQFHR
jgi:hypothetical protein